MAKKPAPRRNVREYKTDVSPYEFEGTLVDLRGRINDWIDQYGPCAKLDWDAYFHHDYETNPSPRYNIVLDRDETDEEYDARMAKERSEKLAQDAKDLAELERLQKKFGVK